MRRPSDQATSIFPEHIRKYSHITSFSWWSIAVLKLRCYHYSSNASYVPGQDNYETIRYDLHVRFSLSLSLSLIISFPATLHTTSSTSHLSTLQSAVPIIATAQSTSSSTMSTTLPTLRRLSPQAVRMSWTSKHTFFFHYLLQSKHDWTRLDRSR